jgi:hypothetical protein
MKPEICPACGKAAPGGLFSHEGNDSEDGMLENQCSVEGCRFGGLRHCGCIWNRKDRKTRGSR